MNSEPFELSTVFNGLSKTYALPVRARGLTLSLGYPSDLPGEMVGDAEKLKQVLDILIDNAIKFTDSGKISIRAKTIDLNDEYVELEFYVRDTGIGMSKEYLKDLFTPFSQANTSSTRIYGGIGMGLALSKHLVTLLGGRIWVESEYGEGSTFHFNARFPLVKEPVLRQVTIEGLQDEQMGEQRTELQEELSGETQADEIVLESGNGRVLLVEDVDLNQIIAEDMLIGLGYRVDIANNGQEAIDMLSRSEFDAILMDIQMPIMDGLTATKIIREKEEYQKLPIIALSAHARPEDREKSLCCGMNDHITKPIDPVILKDTLMKCLTNAA